MNRPVKFKPQQEDPWVSLRSFTDAKIALGRTGTSIPLQHTLALKMAHANARDAVYSSLNEDKLLPPIADLSLPVLSMNSMASNRKSYLQRPDYGRRLNEVSARQLAELKSEGFDVAVILGDGLSASAIQQHAVPVLNKLVRLFEKERFSIAPVCIVHQARVAISDEIGHLLKAKIAVIMIGERPGLSSSDSMGSYITYHPKVGLTDESRNCISNIRPAGLCYEAAADKIFSIIKKALRLRLSGVLLKDTNNDINELSEL